MDYDNVTKLYKALKLKAEKLDSFHTDILMMARDIVLPKLHEQIQQNENLVTPVAREILIGTGFNSLGLNIT